MQACAVAQAASVRQISRCPRGLVGSGMNWTPFTTFHLPLLSMARSDFRLAFFAYRFASAAA
jgi:hypothetical protein